MNRRPGTWASSRAARATRQKLSDFPKPRNGRRAAGEGFRAPFTNGTRDTTFRTARSPFRTTPPRTTVVRALALQADGKILIGGIFSTINGIKRDQVARLHRDGSLDTNFAASAHIDPSGQPPSYTHGVKAIVVRPDGKIVIGGFFDSVNGVARRSLARLNSDGTLDLSFDVGDGVMLNGSKLMGDIDTLVLQSNGKLLFRGYTTNGYGISPILARLNADGSVDPSFQPRGYSRVLQQPDGKLLLDDGCLTRLNADGSVDASFLPCPGRAIGSEGITPLAVRSDGMILGQTWKFTPPSHSSVPGLIWLNPDGSLNRSLYYRGSIFGADSSVSAAAFVSDGSALVAGSFTQLNNAPRGGLVRLFPGGNPPAIQFAADRIRVREDGRSVTLTVQRIGETRVAADVDYATIDGSGLAGQEFHAQRGTIHFAPLETSKTITIPILDNPLVNANKDFEILLSRPTPGVLLGLGPSVSKITIADDEHPGSVDPHFNPSLNFETNYEGGVTDPVLLLQADGKVIVGGGLLATNPITRQATSVVRLNADGSLDNTFSLVVPYSTRLGWGGELISERAVYALAAQSDGRILLGGVEALAVNGQARRNVARVHPDGTLDPEFNADIGTTNAIVRKIAPQLDGRILVVAEFPNLTNGVRLPALTRLLSNSQLDQGFRPGEIAGAVWTTEINSILPQPDGKILIAGDFTSVGGQRRNAIARLNSDGSLDTGFVANLAANGKVSSMALQADEKIIVTGDFNSVPGGIARLNPNGSLDRSLKDFIAGGLGANDLSHPPIAVLQRDGKILLAGSFFTAGNGGSIQSRQGVARVNSNGTLDTSFAAGGGFYLGEVCCELAQGPISSVLALPDGSLIVGGGFTSFDGVPRRGLARLRGDPPPRFVSIVPASPLVSQMSLNCLPGRTYAIEASADLQSWMPVRTNTASSYLLNIEVIEERSSLHRFYRAVSR
ncbi:MAG: hypothetical protein HY735_35305 [Verrucomicrobia bacterium]|nr:hypothetical protein [Verrucomicrobiota bacterium]